ncbi:MAG: lysylphosphatidylglycerol synthase domain-containing protein [Elainellaceae cyanobacterium]
MGTPRYQQWMVQSKQVVARFKPLLRWLVLGGTLFFLVSTLRQHWSGVTKLRVDTSDWAILAIALGVTLLAHIWSGWVWSWILRELNQPAQGTWGVLTYLKTNIAKYLPGNVWHFYGRVVAAKDAGFAVGAATLSVLLEPLLMAAAALAIALLSLNTDHWLIQGLSLGLVLVGIHPRILNPLLKVASRLKTKSSLSDSPNLPAASTTAAAPLQLKRYPILPLYGEFVFVVLRGIGFILTVWVLNPVTLAQIPTILSGFSFAWLLGLVVPGAPGGLGVFEATAIALLSSHLSPAAILGSVALYRLISTLAEAGGAGLAWLDDRLDSFDKANG